MQFGIQLYGPFQTGYEDPAKFFTALKSMGYRYVEPCLALGDTSGTGGFASSTVSIWGGEAIDTHMKEIAENGMQVKSCHVFAKDRLAAVRQIEALSKRYGFDQVVINCPQPVEIEIYRAFADTCISLADALKRFGVELLLHNGSTEIATHFGEITAYEWVLRRGAGKIGAQPDVGWLLHGGEDPLPFLERNRAYIKSFHYKDMRAENGVLTETPLGTGILDVQSCYKFANGMRLPQFADQDSSEGDMLDDLRHSAALLGLTAEK